MSDGEQIERALRAHLASEAARKELAPGDLERAARALGPPFVSLGADDRPSPKLGRYSVAAADPPGSLEIRNTVQVSPGDAGDSRSTSSSATAHGPACRWGSGTPGRPELRPQRAQRYGPETRRASTSGSRSALGAR